VAPVTADERASSGSGPDEDSRLRALLAAFAACGGNPALVLGLLRELLGEDELQALAARWAARAGQEPAPDVEGLESG
jgi:hypothetical protein